MSGEIDCTGYTKVHVRYGELEAEFAPTRPKITLHDVLTALGLDETGPLEGEAEITLMGRVLDVG